MIDIIKKYYKEPLYRNSIVLILNSAFGSLFGLLFWIVAARTVSSEDIGLATAAISAAALILALSMFGLDQGLVRYLPEVKEKNSFYSSIVILTLAFSLTISGVFLIGINVFSPVLSFIRESWFLLAFLAYIFVTSIHSIQNIAFIAIRRADLSMTLNLLLGMRVPALLFLAPFGVIGVFSAFGVAYLVTLLVGLFILYRYGLSITRNFDITSIKKILKFSLGNYSAGIFSMAPVTIIPIMILNTIGAKEGAYFYIAYSIASLLFVIPTAVSTSLFVEGSHNLPLKENVLKSVKLIFILLIPALIIIFLFGDKILLLFSREYSDKSFEMLQLLAISSIFSAVISIYISIKKIQKDVSMVNYVNFVLSILIIGIGYAALLKYGLLGVGYAWLGANALICAMLVGLIKFKEKWL
ncbi:MAG: oligosaccharide flippase family protein [Methanolobus sp.]|uniref:oligosaccharide flippase family protein n=1 Tax=Methanolobus sp. TaxID=1874737 RepID=UPI0027318659|nr:oligosaccharide flippase family protein [Methanolobus sp.]MDP2216450.1 oligosaccharide flippase family protein [Methanolobus sp.]